MRTKQILGSFLAFATVLFLAATVSAVPIVGDNYNIEVSVNDGENTITAGETTIVEVWVTARSGVVDRDVTVEVEIDADDFKVSAETSTFDIRPGDTVKRTLRLEIPRDLEDKLFDEDVTLEITVRGDKHKDIFPVEDFLSVKRVSYDVAIKSVSASQTVDAGDELAVDFVLKNIGFNDLDDLYVTASIKALGVMKSGYFGDIVALECDDSDEDEFPWSDDLDVNGNNSIEGNEIGLGLDRNCDEDDEDTVSGRLMLEVPQNAAPGDYMIEVSVENEDTSSTKNAQVRVTNAFESVVFKSGNSIWLVNPTDNVVGYRLVAQSPATVSESIVFVSAGASQSVDVEPNAQGEYTFDVKVFTVTGELVDSVTFSGTTAEGATDDSETGTNPVVVLTIILAIIFIVLLVVLIVLLGKKPKESGEFGESYY